MDQNNREGKPFNSFNEQNFNFPQFQKQTIYCVLAYIYILLYSIAPILASVSALLEILWLIFYVIFTFWGIKNAVKQDNKPLPVIGSLFNFVK